MTRRLAILAVMLLASGCGYHFGASGTNLPANAQTIYVERFDNHTRQTGLNDEFMVYMKDEIASHKRLSIVDSPANADLELDGAGYPNPRGPQCVQFGAGADAIWRDAGGARMAA